MEPQPPSIAEAPHAHPSRRRRPLRRYLFVILALYLLIAYLLLPMIWHRAEMRHPALENAPDLTHTGAGIPGDPIDLALVGSEADLHRAMLAIKWFPADPITLRSSLRIAEDVILSRPYDDAPVSSLYFFGRKEDFAFEQPVGDDPRKRHHVRFWKSDKPDANGRPLWFGSATFDVAVGLSHDTGQITHHIAPEVDADRDRIIDELKSANLLDEVTWKDDFHPQKSGKNGEGDPWRTDGRLAIGVLKADVPATRPATAPVP